MPQSSRTRLAILTKPQPCVREYTTRRFLLIIISPSAQNYNAGSGGGRNLSRDEGVRFHETQDTIHNPAGHGIRLHGQDITVGTHEAKFNDDRWCINVDLMKSMVVFEIGRTAIMAGQSRSRRIAGRDALGEA